MDFFQAIIYGIVQGVGEFLPISSTAHLDLLPWLTGWKLDNETQMVFDVALHLGTGAAVIIYFFKDWIRLISAGFTKPKSVDGKLFWLIVLATIPGAIAGVFLDKFVAGLKDDYLIIGIMLIIMGAVLYIADRVGKSQVELEGIGIKRSVLVGISQVFAMIPGVSRSGITMSTGRFLGMKRDSIARFTFLMSAPIIMADAVYHAKDIVQINLPVVPFVTAIITAGVVGLLSIRFLLNYLKTKGFGIFVIYRFALGAIVIILALAGFGK